MTECNLELPYDFYSRRPLVVRFSGLELSSDEEIVLDIDGWDDPTHGNQQLGCFHGYYGPSHVLSRPD
jgi:hypothetical protein